MTEKAAFGAGCFWGVEETFRQLDGVIRTAVGYMGGTLQDPSYEQVCTGETGHAEVVMIEYDPTVIRYERLLETFWACHDPTQHNRQGPDVGTQYRSAIFFMSEEQREIAQKSMIDLTLSGKYKGEIATTLEATSVFYLAEEYHQKYLQKQGRSSCHL